MNPAQLHNVERDRMNRFIFTRSHSNQRGRNPILDGDELPASQPHKTKVPTYLVETKKVSDRARGIGKSVYSNQLFDSFNVGNDPVLPYRPFKRQAEKQHATVQDTSRSNTKRMLKPHPDDKNPILQDSRYEQPVVYTKKRGYPESPSRVVCEEKISPAVTHSKRLSYSRRNSSNIFNQGDDIDIFGTRKKAFQEGTPVTGSIIQYEYALPYRDIKVTDKVF